MPKVYARALSEVAEELDRALRKYSAFNTAHEGIAVIQEELDELWDEVKRKPKKRRLKRMEREAVQLAAMAIRFRLECCK